MPVEQYQYQIKCQHQTKYNNTKENANTKPSKMVTVSEDLIQTKSLILSKELFQTTYLILLENLFLKIWFILRQESFQNNCLILSEN